MIEIGKKQKLIVAKTVDFGVYLAEDKNAGQEDRVLLPVKQVPEGTREAILWTYLFTKIPETVLLQPPENASPGWPDCSSESPSGNQDRCLSGLGLRERSAPSIP